MLALAASLALAQADAPGDEPPSAEEPAPASPALPDAEEPLELPTIEVIEKRNPWGLPDLGTRRPPEPEEPEGPWQVEAFPLYDPEEEARERQYDLLRTESDIRDVGRIKLFEIRF
jgi:hypothetical protein